jgi:hypothetical protein
MSNLKNYFLELILIALLIRCLALGTGIGEALFAISLVISITYKEFYAKKQDVTDKDDLYKRIDDLSSAINMLKLNNGIKRGLTNEEKTLRKY